MVSAPSGAGKTTLIQHVMQQFGFLSYSISHTTRKPRGNEQHGKDYFFIDPETFKQKIEQQEWLEWARVHGNYYGTSKKFISEQTAKGKHLVLDVDVQGALQIMSSELKPVTIFIQPPSIKVLAQRLKTRGTDSETVIQKRLANAQGEMDQKGLYQYVVINDDLDQAQKELIDIFENEMTIAP